MDCKREEIQARATNREFFFKSLIREIKTCIWTGAMARENGGKSKQWQRQCVPDLVKYKPKCKRGVTS